MEIKGKGRIFAKDMGGWTAYSIGISNKNQDGSYSNAYQAVRLRKGESIPNNTDIDFVAFPTVMKGQKYNSVIWQITEFRIACDDMASPQNEIGFKELTENDIPF